MLSIWYGDIDSPAYVNDPDGYFDFQYEESWLEDEQVRAMIRDIDHSEVIAGEAIRSAYQRVIGPEKLSGGVKTLILMKFVDDRIFNASACGDNCAPWILRIGQTKDLLIRLGHMMDFGDGSFEIRVQNTGVICRDLISLDDEVFDKHLLQGA